MSNHVKYTKYTFRGRSGYVVPHNSDALRELIAIGHTASVAPWTDPDVHMHEGSEEYYVLLQGELWILVAEFLVTLRSREILMVRPQVPHAIVRGEERIEHLGIRVPALSDKRAVGRIPAELPRVGEENERELRCDWGYRIPLEDVRNQNRWLIGLGSARFQSSHLILAYLNFPTAEAANAGIGTRHRLHLHERSWEYDTVLEGTKTLWIEDELVELKAGEILEVPPRVKHTLHGRKTPYKGFTLRVPVALDDKVEC